MSITTSVSIVESYSEVLVVSMHISAQIQEKSHRRVTIVVRVLVKIMLYISTSGHIQEISHTGVTTV